MRFDNLTLIIKIHTLVENLSRMLMSKHLTIQFHFDLQGYHLMRTGRDKPSYGQTWIYGGWNMCCWIMYTLLSPSLGVWACSYFSSQPWVSVKKYGSETSYLFILPFAWQQSISKLFFKFYNITANQNIFLKSKINTWTHNIFCIPSHY